MTTIFDYLTMAIFVGLVVLFLQRSLGPESDYDDHLWQYLAAGGGCAVANYVGNEGYFVVGALAIVATLVFIAYSLRPFPNFPPR